MGRSCGIWWHYGVVVGHLGADMGQTWGYCVSIMGHLNGIKGH